MFLNLIVREHVVGGEDKRIADAIRIGCLGAMADSTDSVRHLVPRGGVAQEVAPLLAAIREASSTARQRVQRAPACLLYPSRGMTPRRRGSVRDGQQRRKRPRVSSEPEASATVIRAGRVSDGHQTRKRQRRSSEPEASAMVIRAGSVSDGHSRPSLTLPALI